MRKKKSLNSKNHKQYLKDWLVQKLRRLSYQWPPRKQAIKNARVSRGKYTCSSCGGIFGPREITLDHIDPVIDPEIGWVDFNTYIDRLFCSLENWSVKCQPCHDIKSFTENEIRKQVRRENLDLVEMPNDEDL